GFGPDSKRVRRKVHGRTKQEVRDKLKALHAELDRGLRTSATYTVRQAVDDWLRGGLPGRADRTRNAYREATAPLLGLIGSRPLRELSTGDVRAALEALSGRLSTRYFADRSGILGAGTQVCRGTRSGWQERGVAGRPAERARGTAESVVHP